jgi:hypothetical protein
MLGNISLAKLDIPTEEKTYEILGESEKACLRAKDLTQQLLTFSRGGAPLKNPSSLRKLIQESIKFALSGSSIECRSVMPDDL